MRGIASRLIAHAVGDYCEQVEDTIFNEVTRRRGHAAVDEPEPYVPDDIPDVLPVVPVVPDVAPDVLPLVVPDALPLVP